MEMQQLIVARIKYLREEKKLTQEELAWKAEVNRTSMNHIENGRRNISVDTLGKIVVALEVSVREFFNDAEFDNNGKRRKK